MALCDGAVSKGESNPVRLGLAVLLTGVLIGIIGGLFFGALRVMDDTRVALIDATVQHSFPGWIGAMIAGLAATSTAAWIAHRYAPHAPQSAAAALSGISGRHTSDLSSITANFAGAGLAVGAGLALGPERPAIQMGGAVGNVVSRLLRLNQPDRELMMAAAGGAGVATMFNSPLGCAAYTVEAVLKRADRRTSLTALGTGAVAVAVVRVFLGRDVNFLVGQLPAAHFEHLFLYLPLGCAIGLISNLHVRTIVTVVGLFQHPRLPSVARGALVGAAIGLLAWMSPRLVGSGDGLIQRVIDGKFVLSGLALMFLVRFFLGPLSLAADTPGGYFTPVLLLGALSGAMYGDLASKWLPAAPPPTAFALVGMAVALATIARAPFTGVLLAMETTGTYVMGLPMIMAVFGSLAVIHLLHSPSIGTGLEALRTRLHKR